MTSVARSRTVIDRALTDDPGSLTNGISGSRDRSQRRMTRASRSYTNPGRPTHRENPSHFGTDTGMIRKMQQDIGARANPSRSSRGRF